MGAPAGTHDASAPLFRQAGAPALRISMVAGEASGDLLAAAVLQGLHQGTRSVLAGGVGGCAMAAEGFDRWWDSDQLAVRGYVEALHAYPRLHRLRQKLGERVISWHPDLFVGVDAPDFNLGLERRLKRAGVRVAHFISPSIWAWRGGRITAIRQSVDHMLLVFPFELALYERAGIPATYVGHPLADAIPAVTDPGAARDRLGLDRSRATIALLPGSRHSEVHFMGRLFVETASWLHQRRGDLQFVLPAAGPLLFDRLRAQIRSLTLPPGLRLQLVQGRSHDALEAADAALVASGTATLEAAFFHRPMVIAYRMAWASHRLMRRMGYLPWIGLPNILAGETLVPEFVQDQATAPAMGAALLAQLDDDALRARLALRFAAMHDEMRLGCSRRAARVLEELCDAART